MANPQMIQLIDDLCRDSADAYDKLRACLRDKVDLEGQPYTSSQGAKQMIDLLSVQAQKGNAPAMAFLGNVYINGWSTEPDAVKALDYARRSASLGHAGGKVLLGFLYGHGLGGVVQNHQRALYWYNQALEQGHSMAMNNLGAMYEQGQAVKKDLKAALKYYQQAANLQNTLAQQNLERLQRGEVLK